MVSQSDTMVSQSDTSQNGLDYKYDFVRFLNGWGMDNKSLSRHHGFIVLVRGSSNLEPIQSLCVDAPQLTSNECFTASYRLQPGAIGTLIMALVSDLNRIVSGQKSIGELFPDDKWKKLVEQDSDRFLNSGLPTLLPPRGSVGVDQLIAILRGLQVRLESNQQLVLFAELSEVSNDSEWQTLTQTLFPELPKHVGIVLSGAPKDFALPKDPAHFLEITLPEGSTADRPPKFLYKFTDTSFHRDEPASQDELDVNDYADALARFILHKQTLPPLTIGIHGRWGKGKSSFMKLVDSALVKYAGANNVKRLQLKRWKLIRKTRTESWNALVKELIEAEPSIQALLAEKRTLDKKEKNERQQQLNKYDKQKKQEARLWKAMTKSAERNIIGVRFNAWQFEDAKQTWAGLASQISERMEQALPWHSRQWLKISYAWEERKSELVLNVLLPLAVVCLVAGLFSLGSFRSVVLPQEIGSGFADLLRLLLPTGSAFLTIWFISSQFLKVAQPVSERVLSYVRLPNYRDQMGFQHRVKDDLQFVYNFLRKRHQGCHVVVYIDDLDRCSEGKIIEILQAINLILASCEFFVFVGMDTEMIYRAIGSYYQGNVPERFPENYLRKIVQISFYLPETKKEKRLDYVNSLFSWKARAGLANSTAGTKEETPQTQGQSAESVPPPPAAGALRYDLSHASGVSIQVEDVEDTADELQALHDHVGFLDDNPRQIKRLINLHRLIKILLQKPNTSWSKERQRKLVKWLVFCEVWPYLVDDILAEKKKRDALSEKLKRDSLNEQEKDAILKEIKKSRSADCLRELSLNLNAVRQKKDLPYLEALGKFVDLKEDVLSGSDIDEDFRDAAYLSQLVRESPEVSPVDEAKDGKSHGPGFFF
jgi:hypothetical protein